jgi:lysophospholipase L1-like esterase
VVGVFPLAGVLLALSMASGLLAADVPQVHLAGDSTMADKPVAPPNPEHGWGQLFPRYFREPAMIVNHAQNGRSTKSFIAEGRWQTLVDALRPGDWTIIQFGHNDQKVEDATRYAGPGGGFRENLRRFVQEVRAKGATPILAPPVARRRWNDAGQLVDTHGAYPDAVRAVAQELAVPLLELNRLTTELEQAHGVEGSKRLHLWIPAGVYERKPDGYRDDTHYSAYGADRVAALAVQEILRLGLPLAEWLK